MNAKSLLLVIIFTNLSVYLKAQIQDAKRVSELVEILRVAIIDADQPTLQKIAAEELSYGHSSGRIEDKDAFIEALVSKKSDFVKIELTDQTIKIVDNLAIVRHKLFGETIDGGKNGIVKIGVLLIFQKQKSDWKLIARQAFKL